MFGGRGDRGFRVRAGAGFVAGGVEVRAERVEDHHGKLCTEAVEIFFRPVAVESRGAGNVFGKGLTEVAFTDQDVADQASSVNVIDPAAGLAASIGQAEKYLAISGELRTVVPGLRG